MLSASKEFSVVIGIIVFLFSKEVVDGKSRVLCLWNMNTIKLVNFTMDEH